MATILERIIYVFSAQGLQDVVNGTQAAGTAAQRAAPAFNALRSAITLIGSGLAINQLRKYSDVFIGIAGRLKIVTNGTEEFTSAQADLRRIANDTRSTLEGTASLYTRLALQKDQLGISSGELIEVVSKVNKAIIASGASATEASGGLIQFTQGLSSGRLQGEELRSVVENLPFLASVLADGLRDVGLISESSIANLRRLGEAGELTTGRLMAAIAAQSTRIDQAFAQMPVTIGQAFIILDNEMTTFIGRLGESTGIASFLADSIVLLANNLETLAPFIGMVVAGFVAFQALEMARSFQAMLTVTSMMISPLTVVITLGAALVVWAATLGREVTVLGTETTTWYDVLMGLANGISSILLPVLNFFGNNIEIVTAAIMTLAGAYFAYNLAAVAYQVITKAITIVTWLFNAALLANPLVWFTLAVIAGTAAIVYLADSLIGTANAADVSSTSLTGTGDAAASVTPEASALDLMLQRVSGSLGAVTATAQTTNDALGASGKAAKDLRTDFDKLNDELFKLNSQLDLSGEQLRKTQQEQLNNSDATKQMSYETRELTSLFPQMGMAGTSAMSSIAAGANEAASAFSSMAHHARDAMIAVNAQRTAGRAAAGSYAGSSKSASSGVSSGAGNALSGGIFKATTGTGKFTTWRDSHGMPTNQIFHQMTKEIRAANSQLNQREAEAFASKYGNSGSTHLSGMLGNDVLERFRKDLRAGTVGFKNGGSFKIGGEGGVDKNLVMFRGSKGEQVDVKTRAQQNDEEKGKTVIIEQLNLIIEGVQDVNDFRRTEKQILRELNSSINRAMR